MKTSVSDRVQGLFISSWMMCPITRRRSLRKYVRSQKFVISPLLFFFIKGYESTRYYQVPGDSLTRILRGGMVPKGYPKGTQKYKLWGKIKNFVPLCEQMEYPKYNRLFWVRVYPLSVTWVLLYVICTIR